MIATRKRVPVQKYKVIELLTDFFICRFRRNDVKFQILMQWNPDPDQQIALHWLTSAKHLAIKYAFCSNEHEN